ncbi:MAG: NUMOD4 domain-containing protein, partial [Deltaproteobacteria bacterium]
MSFDKSEYNRGEVVQQIPGFEGLYTISSYGKVQRLVAGNNTYPGKILKPLLNKKTGYPYVKLTKNGKVYKKQLHLL